MNAKKGQKDSKGEVTVYNLEDLSYNQMKDRIINLPEEQREYLMKILLNFPENATIFEQCAYYFRAFSRGQIFADANHRTGFFSLGSILKRKGIKICADNDDINSMTEYIKAEGWINLCDMDVNLKEKDEEYEFLVGWFREKLEFR